MNKLRAFGPKIVRATGFCQADPVAAFCQIAISRGFAGWRTGCFGAWRQP